VFETDSHPTTRFNNRLLGSRVTTSMPKLDRAFSDEICSAIIDEQTHYMHQSQITLPSFVRRIMVSQVRVGCGLLLGRREDAVHMALLRRPQLIRNLAFGHLLSDARTLLRRGINLLTASAIGNFSVETLAVHCVPSVHSLAAPICIFMFTQTIL